MLSTTKKKQGRPQAVYRTSWGDQVPGLMRLADGRWRASGPEKYTFTESDERVALARFHQWQARREGAMIDVPFVVLNPNDPDSVRHADAILPRPGADPSKLTGTFLPPDLPASAPVPTTE